MVPWFISKKIQPRLPLDLFFQGRGPQVPECGCYSLSVFHMIFRIT